MKKTSHGVIRKLSRPSVGAESYNVLLALACGVLLAALLMGVLP